MKIKLRVSFLWNEYNIELIPGEKDVWEADSFDLQRVELLGIEGSD